MTRPELISAWALGAALVAGCVSDGGRADRPGPGPQPRNAVPSRLAVAMPNFDDTDRNGFADTGRAVVYVFAAGYDVPLDIAGSFVFRLYDRNGAVLAEWDFPLERADAARIRNAVGHGYDFILDLRAVGAERLSQTEGRLVAEFTDAKGRRIASEPTSPVSIGRTR